jgi:hypothetical protein
MTEAAIADYRTRRRLDEESGPVTQILRTAPATAPIVRGLLTLNIHETTPSKPGAEAAYLNVIVHDPARSGRLLALFNRLEKMRSLGNNWDSYGAVAPNARAIFYAQEILSSLMHRDLHPDRVNPSVENGVTFSFSRGDRYADIECFNSGEVLAVTTDGVDEPDVWSVSVTKEEVSHTIERIRAFLKIDG